MRETGLLYSIQRYPGVGAGIVRNVRRFTQPFLSRDRADCNRNGVSIENGDENRNRIENDIETD